MRVKRILTAISVLVILIALPALSWFYLNKGADWRREGLNAMADKRSEDILHQPLILNDGRTLQLESGRFVIASNILTSNQEVINSLDKLAEQFNHRTDLTYLYIGQPTRQLTKEWQTVDCTKSDCEDWRTKIFTGSSNAVLIDDSLYVRAVYDIGSLEQVQQLVEHAAILFPVEKRAKIELKRGANQ